MEKSASDDVRFRPRIGGRRGKVPVQKAPRFCQSILIRAQLRFTKAAGLGARAVRKLGTRAVADVPRPPAHARRCVVKARVVPMNARGIEAARLHLTYIERDGVEQDGSPGRLYGPEETIDRDILSSPIRGERHQFRFIVSPEDAVDLTLVVRRLMAQAEKDLGLDLRWGAVNHHDTDNPHAHVVVRGVDAKGRQVFIDREYISNWMRWQAQHILTEELGPRLAHDIDRQLDREVGQERLTSLDRRLAVLTGPEGTFNAAQIGSVADSAVRKRLAGRLRFLETLQLATRTSRTTWRLGAGWQEALRELGERDDIIKKLHRALGPEADISRSVVVDGGADHPPVEGVLRRKGLHDELRGDGYVIVETGQGAPVYARVDLTTAEAIPERSIVRIAVERQSWAKPMDRVLQAVARENGGIYDAEAHRRALVTRPLVVKGQQVPPAEVIAANLRRLARLERHHLVTRLGRGDGRWRVPLNLLETLGQREVTHPRRAVRVQVVAPPLGQQVSMRAQCWLDRQDPNAIGSTRAVGSEIARATRARESFLAQLGISPAPSAQRLKALMELERLDAARQLGRAHGMSALAQPPVGMRGRLIDGGQGAGGAPLAALIDDVNGRLVVLPLSESLRSLVGRRVAVTRDQAGRFRLTPDDLGRGA